DTYRVLGFIVASERLFQMDLMRRLVRGTLSEVFGDKTLKADKLLRTLRFRKHAQDYWEKNKEKLPRKISSIMDAYLEGIHYYIQNENLPVEFNLLGYTPEKFEVSDLIGITYYQAMTFAEGLTGDILMTDLLENLPEDKMEIIRVGAKSDLDYFGSKKIVKSDVIKSIHDSLGEIKEYLPLFHGSNSWVISPKRSISGKAVLANDPHIGTGNPHIFYEAHIKHPGLEVYGHFIPLLPFPVLGHTRYSAWGLTMAEIDDLTIYAEKFNPQDENQVMYNNKWVDVEKYQEHIRVKDGKDVVIDVIVTPHGPLLDNTKYATDGKRLALTWSVYHPQNHMLQSLYEYPQARTINDFSKAVSHAAAPGINISWINIEGDIAWWVMGKFPKLPKGVPYDMVLKGWDGTHEIERYYSHQENPHEINPESGVIVTANYKPQHEKYSHFDGYWQPAGRYFRILELLSKKEKWSADDFKLIQYDNMVPIVEQMRGQIVKGLNAESLSEFELKMLKFYEEWDGQSDKQSVGTTIFHMLNYQLAANAFKDELGEEGFQKFGRLADFWHAYKKLLFNQNHSFWDNTKTDHVESGKDIILRSFQESAQKLKTKLGARIDRWNWGKLHTAEYKHPLGKVKPLNLLYNIGPIPADGGRYVINNLGHNKSTDDFSVVHAPATRRIVDMADIENSQGILPTGNSGNPFSENFDDQLKLY
ncbi:MAG: penicillin acylase family protein, partial [Flavobacteriaceae bacterium]|nr:penicillin acylase family protein [Flavobacteriaceae bacterium]